jgi:hypothetical protein
LYVNEILAIKCKVCRNVCYRACKVFITIEMFYELRKKEEKLQKEVLVEFTDKVTHIVNKIFLGLAFKMFVRVFNLSGPNSPPLAAAGVVHFLRFHVQQIFFISQIFKLTRPMNKIIAIKEIKSPAPDCSIGVICIPIGI